jgi:replicative DNA helicase
METKLIDCEYQILSAIIQDESRGEKSIGLWERVKDNLSIEAFSSEECREIFKAILDLKKDGKPADMVMLCAEKFKEPEKVILIANLIDACVTPSNVNFYIREVGKAYLIRKLREVVQKSEDTNDIDEFIEQISEARKKLDNLGTTVPSMQEIMVQLYDNIIESPLMPLPTFSATLNQNLNGGLQRGKLFLITGIAGGGKSTFAYQLLEEIAGNQQIHCLFIAIEQTREDLLIKSLSRLGSINSGHIERKDFLDKEYESTHNLLKKLSQPCDDYFTKYAPYMHIIDNMSTPTVAEIKWEIIKLQNKLKDENKDTTIVLCIDPLQRLSSGSLDRDNNDPYGMVKVEAIASQLKRLAKDLKIPIIALSDTTKSKAEDMEEGKKGGGGAFRGSYMLAHIPDITAEIRTGPKILESLIKDKDDELSEKYRSIQSAWSIEKAEKSEKAGFPTYAILDISKQKTGSTIKAVFLYYKAFNKFVPIEPA